MAMLLLLSVLVAGISYHGTLANTGCIISKGGLENFYHSSKDSFQSRLEIDLKALAPLTVPEHFIQLTVASVAVTKMELTMVPASGLHVTTCASIRLHCVTLDLLMVTLTADVCNTVRLKVVAVQLVIDDCSSVFGDIQLDLLSLSEVPRTALIAVLGDLICQAHTAVCRKLNFPLLVDMALISMPTGCRYDPFSPRITASSLELSFAASCTGVSKPQSPVLRCGRSYPGVLDNNLVHYTSGEDMTCLLTALLNAKVLDREITLAAMTTTTILDNFPQVRCPRGLSVVVRIVCTGVGAEVGLSGISINFIFTATIGYVPPRGGYVPILRFVLTGRFGSEATINCPRRLILVTVTVLRSFSIVGSCETGLCDIDNAVAERVFPLRTWCKDILSVNLKERFHLLLPAHFSCESCSTSVYRQGCAYTSCKPVIVW